MSEYVSYHNDAVKAEQCYFCPNKTNLETHHIVPQRKNGSDKRENLVIVCNKCHQKLESLYDKRFFERLGLSDDKGTERSHFACRNVNCKETAVCEVESVDRNWWCEEHAARIVARNGEIISVLDSTSVDEIESQALDFAREKWGFRCL